MKLEVGKKYVLRSGQVVGPLYSEVSQGETRFMSDDRVDIYFPIWLEDGTADFFANPKDNCRDHDIVKELDESL